jgi:hypothetical protein
MKVIMVTEPRLSRNIAAFSLTEIFSPRFELIHHTPVTRQAAKNAGCTLHKSSDVTDLLTDH